MADLSTSLIAICRECITACNWKISYADDKFISFLFPFRVIERNVSINRWYCLRISVYWARKWIISDWDTNVNQFRNRSCLNCRGFEQSEIGLDAKNLLKRIQCRENPSHLITIRLETCFNSYTDLGATSLQGVRGFRLGVFLAT